MWTTRTKNIQSIHLSSHKIMHEKVDKEEDEKFEQFAS